MMDVSIEFIEDKYRANVRDIHNALGFEDRGYSGWIKTRLQQFSLTNPEDYILYQQKGKTQFHWCTLPVAIRLVENLSYGHKNRESMLEFLKEHNQHIETKKENEASEEEAENLAAYFCALEEDMEFVENNAEVLRLNAENIIGLRNKGLKNILEKKLKILSVEDLTAVRSAE